MYTVEYAKTGRSGCRSCNGAIGKAELRVGKMAPVPGTSASGLAWYHHACFWRLHKCRWELVDMSVWF
jgi:hypothetical protein